MQLRKYTIVVILLVQNERDKRTLAVKVGMHRKILIQSIFRQYNLEEYSDLLDVGIETEVCISLFLALVPNNLCNYLF